MPADWKSSSLESVDNTSDKAQRVSFSPSILPAYLRRIKTIDELIPWLYLKGISTGDFQEALQALLGADAIRRKELIAVVDGYRESEQSWYELLIDLKKRGLSVAPKLAVGDGALGFWAALRKVFGETREQRCWVHKTANVLNKMPKSIQPKAKADIHEVWMAATREDAEKAFDT